MDLGKLLAAYAALSGAHTLNHLSVANQSGTPASFHGNQGTENWQIPESEFDHQFKKVVEYDPNAANGEGDYVPVAKGFKTLKSNTSDLYKRNETDRNGAGFEGQDKVNAAMDSPESSLANAVSKGAYIASGGGIGKSKDLQGDFGGVSVNSGVSRDKIKGMVGFSAMSDLYNASHPDNTTKVGFSTLNQGTPGLVASVPVDQNLIPVFNRNSTRK
jgi:hypothetical protein